jgi:type I restriction enzyme S subunit
MHGIRSLGDDENEDGCGVIYPNLPPKKWSRYILSETCHFLDRLRKPVNETVRRERIVGKDKNRLYPYYGANGQAGWIDDYIFDEELILLAEDGGFFGSSIRCIAYKITGKTWVNNHAHVLRPREGFDIDFIYYSLMIRPDIKDLVSGNTRDKLNQKIASEISIFAPALSEQQRIASVIETKLKSVEKAKQAAEEQLKAADALQEAYLREVFGFDKLPQGWKWKKIGNCCSIINGSTPKTSIDKYWGGNIIWVTPKDLGRNKTKYIADSDRKITQSGYDSANTNLIPPQSIVLSTRAPIGYIAMNNVELCTNQGCKGIIPDKLVYPDFVFYYLCFSKNELDELGSGSTFKELSTESLKHFFIPLPPLTEQKRIVNIIETKFKSVEKTQQLLNQQLSYINAFPPAILRQAFNGEL